MLHPVLFQDVLAKIVSFFPPNGMNVVGIVLKADIVVFDQEVGTVDHIVVRLHRLIAAYPGKVHFLHSTRVEFGEVFFGLLVLQISDKFLYQVVRSLVACR